MKRTDFHVGDRVRFISQGYKRSMVDQLCTIVYVTTDDLDDELGVEFDDPVAYGHECSGLGKSPDTESDRDKNIGYCVWCCFKDVSYDLTPECMCLPPLSEMLML